MSYDPALINILTTSFIILNNDMSYLHLSHYQSFVLLYQLVFIIREKCPSFEVENGEVVDLQTKGLISLHSQLLFYTFLITS